MVAHAPSRFTFCTHTFDCSVFTFFAYWTFRLFAFHFFFLRSFVLFFAFSFFLVVAGSDTFGLPHWTCCLVFWFNGPIPRFPFTVWLCVYVRVVHVSYTVRLGFTLSFSYIFTSVLVRLRLAHIWLYSFWTRLYSPHHLLILVACVFHVLFVDYLPMIPPGWFTVRTTNTCP